MTRLTQEQIDEIRGQHETRRMILSTGAYFATEGAHENHNDIAALLGHIEATPAVTVGWRPIETAPVDTDIQAWSEKYKWRGASGVVRGYVHADYNGHKRVFTLDGCAGHVPDDKPTHWQPLPAPPARGMGKTEA